MISLLSLLIVLLGLLAGPYRVLAYQFGSFGGFGMGLVTWIGLVVGFPLFINGESGGYVWAALLILAWLQMFAKWCAKERLEEGVSHFWLGRGEWIFVALLYVASGMYCGEGCAAFFLLGFAGSTLQNGLVRLRRRCEAWTAEDTQRVLSWGRKAFERSRGSLPGPHAVYPYRASFRGRLTTFITGHMVLSLIWGVVGWNIFGILLAIPLWFLGWDPRPPKDVRETGRTFVGRVKDALAETKEEAIERLEREKRELAEKLDGHKEEIGRTARRTMWNSFLP